MMQRKLTDKELQSVLDARQLMKQIQALSGIAIHNTLAVLLLEAMATHATTDGNPWTEPQPEIGEGYRRATEADKDRQDRQVWNFDARKWQPALHGSTSAAFYRVPIDRIPTDEDAVGRPIVMVRDADPQEWLPRKLLAVYSKHPLPFLIRSADGFTTWKQARFLYPGELD